MDNTLLITEANDDGWYTEQEGLRPELEQLPLILQHIAIIADLSRCLQLDPVYCVFLSFWFAVPHC